MNQSPHRAQKIILITLAVLIGLIGLVILFLSPIVKFLVQKYDRKFTGREITIDWAYVNPFTGYVHLDDLRFFEKESDSVFFSASGISARLSMSKLIRGEYEIKSLSLDKPYGIIIQYTKEKFNFTDLIEKFSKDPDEEKKKDTSKVKFSLLDFTVTDGTFYMQEKLTPVSYFIKKVMIESSGLRWDADTIDTRFNFESGIGSGTVEGDLKMNLATKLYNTHIIIRRLDLKIIEQYLKDMSNYGTMKAMINADIKATGDMSDGRNVDAVGGVGIYEFRFGKSPGNDFAAFKKFVIKINHLNPKKQIYTIDSISLVEPFFRYEKYDRLDNIQTMFGKKGQNVKEAARSEKFNLVIAIADYIKLLAKNFFQSNYKVNRLGIYRGDLEYDDYSINEKFSVGLKPFTLTADSLDSKDSRAIFKLNTGISPYGNLNVRLSINPRDSSDFDLNYHLQKVNAALLNPFLLSFTSFPLDRGSIEFKGSWKVLNGNIKSTNNLLVIDPRITKRMKTNDNRWLPLKFIMFFVRERGNAIDYEIPISGNLKNPKFHVRDVVFDVISNIFIKPATTPYSYKIRNIESSTEKTIAYNWEFGSAEIMPDQDDFPSNVADFLRKNPEASLVIYPLHYAEKEKEYIAFFEAKKKYFLEKNNKKAGEFSAEDSVMVSRMSPKDSLFNLYMRNHLKDQLMFTTQELCRAFVGAKNIEARFERLKKKRRDTFMNYFKEEGVESRISITEDKNGVPYNGFSYYQVSYNGDIPENMKEAFESLREYDNENPRKKLKEERQKTRRFFNFKRKSGNKE